MFPVNLDLFSLSRGLAPPDDRCHHHQRRPQPPSSPPPWLPYPCSSRFIPLGPARCRSSEVRQRPSVRRRPPTVRPLAPSLLPPDFRPSPAPPPLSGSDRLLVSSNQITPNLGSTAPFLYLRCLSTTGCSSSGVSLGDRRLKKQVASCNLDGIVLVGWIAAASREAARNVLHNRKTE